MSIEIISVGDELLIGQVVNTNAAWIGDQLGRIGVSARYITTVGDSAADVSDSLKIALSRVDGVIVTGGLGPTHDDITKKVVADFYGCNGMRTDEAVLNHIVAAFTKRNIPLGKRNEEQALIPNGAEVLWNNLGTAPGLLFKREDQYCIVLPGVPAEMKFIMENSVLPLLKERNGRQTIIHRTVKTFGIPESSLASLLDPISDIEEYAKIAFLPSYMGVRLRMTASGSDRTAVENRIRAAEEIIVAKAGRYIIGFGDDSMELLIGQMLREKKATLAIAESCTGGRITSLITDIPGSSDYFGYGFVTYSNAAKIAELGVSPETIDEHGAVSEQCVREMAEGVRQISGAVIGLATTGIAGPGGGSEEKPVGLVWIGISTPAQTKAKQYLFTQDRKVNKERFSQTALGMLYHTLKDMKDLDGASADVRRS